MFNFKLALTVFLVSLVCISSFGLMAHICAKLEERYGVNVGLCAAMGFVSLVTSIVIGFSK